MRLDCSSSTFFVDDQWNAQHSKIRAEIKTTNPE